MKRLSKPPTRRTSSVRYATQEDEGRILSQDEKHELIRAHAATRQKRPHGYKLGYYIAVAASCLVVVTSYALTVNYRIAKPMPKPDPVYEEFVQNIEKFKQELDQTSEKVKNAKNQFQAATATSTNTP